MIMMMTDFFMMRNSLTHWRTFLIPLTVASPARSSLAPSSHPSDSNKSVTQKTNTHKSTTFDVRRRYFYSKARESEKPFDVIRSGAQLWYLSPHCQASNEDFISEE